MNEDFEKFKDSLPLVFENIIIRFLIVTTDLTQEEFEIERGNLVFFIKDHIIKLNNCDTIREKIQDLIDDQDFSAMASLSGVPEEEIEKMKSHRKNVRRVKPQQKNETSSEGATVIAVDFTKKK